MRPRICIFGDAGSVHLRRVARVLVDHRWRVHVVSHKSADLPGATVERFRVPGPSLTNLRSWPRRWRHYLRGFLRGFDLTAVFFLHDWGLTPDLFASGKVVLWPWGSDVVAPPGEDHPPESLVEARRALIQHAAAIHVCGPTFARMTADFAEVEPSRIDVLPLGVDLDLFRPSKTVRVRPPQETLRVGFYKGFRAVYGPDCLIEAIPMVVEAVPHVSFDLVGDGPLLQECKQRATALGVQQWINWLPRRPHEEIPAALAEWDLTVIPSRCESFGVAALESMAMGVPVVASRVGGLPDVILHEKTGLLVPPESPNELAEAVIRLLRNADFRGTLARQGRAHIRQNYDWSRVSRRWSDYYHAQLEPVRPADASRGDRTRPQEGRGLPTQHREGYCGTWNVTVE